MCLYVCLFVCVLSLCVMFLLAGMIVLWLLIVVPCVTAVHAAGTYAMPARGLRALLTRVRGALRTDISSNEGGCAWLAEAAALRVCQKLVV